MQNTVAEKMLYPEIMFSSPICFRIKNLVYIIGAARGGTHGTFRTPPPASEKIALEKWCYFRSLYFYEKSFQNSLKNQFSYCVFIKIISKYCQNFQPIIKFPPNARKGNTWFVKIFWKSAQIMHFNQFLKKKLWKLSKISQLFRTISVFRPKARNANTCLVKDVRGTW